MNRREFIKRISALVFSFFAVITSPISVFSAKLKNSLKRHRRESSVKFLKGKTYKLSQLKGKDVSALTIASVDALGGMERFIKSGDIVVVKPNMSWDRSPELAGNTNPEVVSSVIKMCYAAGAKKVKVFDRTCANPQRSYASSGVAAAAEKAGAQVFHFDQWNCLSADFEYDSPMQDWPVSRDVLKADCFINIPILKHHRLAKLTLSIKNLMGVVGGQRGKIHWGIEKKLAHLLDYIYPDLTIIDATRVLMANGPSGGDINDVKVYDTIISSTDAVLADSTACRLVDTKPKDIGYIKEALSMGLGSMTTVPAKILQRNF